MLLFDLLVPLFWLFQCTPWNHQQVWQHAERADGIMSGGGGILSYHATCPVLDPVINLMARKMP
jgi:hypothetical protein